MAAGRSGVLKELQAIEAARDAMRAPSFMAGLFAGRPRFDLVVPFPAPPEADRAAADAFCARLEAFLRERVDPAAIEREARIPPEVLRGLADLGCFGLLIPKEFGGLGFSQTAYNRVLMLVGSYCNVLALLLSAHQSIGVSRPLLLFGTEAQKRAWLPRIAAGAISGFALTEPGVGSDPAGMATSATLSPDGRHYLLTGEKLWCTNGGLAEVLVLMAKVDGAITAFIVDTRSPGIELLHRCAFMGCRGIDNAWLRFTDVAVPVENVIGTVGRGLRIALTTLNTGRISLAALCLGMAKQLYAPTVGWANARRTFGKPIGEHELNAHKLARLAADLFAMEALTWLVSGMIDRAQADFRLESAAAKLFCSERLWAIADTAMQIRGGRAYETADSLRARGEAPVPVEQLLRDARLYLIGEGASEILTLFIAREAWDAHLRRARGWLASRGPARALRTLPLAAFYGPWYARQWVRRPPAQVGTGSAGDRVLDEALRYVEATSRRLARATLYALVRHGAALERKQALVARLAAIGVDLFVVTAAAAYAAHVGAQVDGADALARQVLADARRRIDAGFRGLGDNADAATTAAGLDALRARYAWLSEGSVRGAWEPPRQAAADGAAGQPAAVPA